jgi:hypothetical protein
MTIAPERITQRSTAWLEHVACRPGMSDDQIADQCGACPVRFECLQDAFDTEDFETYRAGMTGDARRRAAKARPTSPQALPTIPVRPRAHVGPVDIDLDQVAAYRDEEREDGPLSWREIGHLIGANSETIRHRWVASGRPRTGRAPNRRRDLRHDFDASDIARRVRAGHSTRRIAHDLRIDWNTADRHVKRARDAGLIP